MMNDRIYSLLRKCTQESIDGSYANPYVDYGKFAELIIRECAMIVEGCERTDEVADGEYQDYEAASMLKDHFGINNEPQ